MKIKSNHTFSDSVPDEQHRILIMALTTLVLRAIYDCKHDETDPEDWYLDIDASKGSFVDLFSHDGENLVFIVHLDGEDLFFNIFEFDDEGGFQLNDSGFGELISELGRRGEFESFFAMVA
ncbi:MAG: hypothetical protein KJ950_17060 [Proteobacteria bacterium]|nr:hypothetical protein [Pseudomonadota bacterium]MBU1685761.1 hypothetical protein [Pseudomonadota bacterium]